MAKIEKNRPLPRHTRLDYDECYAKLVLEHFFPNNYCNLTLSDRPDLRDTEHNIGIEVTSAIPQKEQEAVMLACEIPFLPEKDQQRRIEYLKKNGYNYTRYYMSHPGRSYSWAGLGLPPIERTFCSDFFHAVSNKTGKLNQGKYAILEQYNLFVQSELYVEDWMPPKILEWLAAASNKEKKYSVIYLLSLNGLFWFNIERQIWGVLDTKNQLFNLAIQARTMVEEGENDEPTEKIDSAALP